MPIRVTNLRLELDESLEALPFHLGKILGVSPAGLDWRILRKSLDTRDKRDIHFVCNAEVRVPEDEGRLVEHARKQARGAKVELQAEARFSLPEPGTKPLRHRPVVVGSGPGGLVAAYFLAERGFAPLVLERGKRVNERIRDVHAFDTGGPLDPRSNYLFGEGGA